MLHLINLSVFPENPTLGADDAQSLPGSFPAPVPLAG